MPIITIPYTPRSAFLLYHNRQVRWSVIVAHRRAGKTVCAINDTIKRAMIGGRDGGHYAYIAPYRNQAKTVAWEYLKHYTKDICKKVNETDLSVDLISGSQIRLFGADNADALRGISLDGAILDEFGDMTPHVWTSVIRPALSDNQGWGTFIGTPKGKNRFYDVWQAAQLTPNWLAIMLKASETGLLPREELDDNRAQMTPEEYDQEFECSFSAAIKGAYYGSIITDLEEKGRIRLDEHDPTMPVYTGWDLGISDSTSIWFAQIIGREIHFIDYLENSSVGLDWYIREIKSRANNNGYIYATHFAPHDIAAREWGSGKSREEMAKNLGIDFKTVPIHSIPDGINAVRMILPRAWFNKDTCSEGVEMLRMYRAEFDEKKGVLAQRPAHDWTSHCADAMRCMCMGLRDSLFGIQRQTSTPKYLHEASLNDLWSANGGSKKENWI